MQHRRVRKRLRSLATRRDVDSRRRKPNRKDREILTLRTEKIRRGDSSKHDSDDEDFTGGGLSASVRNFSVTQMALDTSDTTWMESKDIVVKGFSINTSSKALMKNADLLINDGQKYGLLGPNGHGKTTLLKMMACGELKIPPGIDMLMVEQECAADDTKAIDAVLSADKQRTKLLKNEKRIIELLESGTWCLETISSPKQSNDVETNTEQNIQVQSTPRPRANNSKHFRTNFTTRSRL